MKVYQSDAVWRGRRLKAALWPTLALAVLVPTFLALGYWQLERADEKRRLQTEYDSRAAQAPVPVGAQRRPAEALRFHRVEASGRYQPAYQFLLDNRVHRGVAGYHVITPLKIEGGETRVLVNRGWIAPGPDRQQLPEVETPGARVRITGVATVPQDAPLLLGALPENDWEPVWQRLDLERYARLVPFPIQPVVVLLDPESPGGGFTRAWSRLDAGIAVHKGYAFQWFALAAAALVIYGVLMRRSVRRGPRDAARFHDR